MATNEEFVIKVKAELAESSINSIQKQIKSLGTFKPTLKLNATQVNKQLREIRNQIKDLSKDGIKLGSISGGKSSVSGAKGSISSILSDYKKLEREISSKQKLKISVDGTNATNTIVKLNEQISELSKRKLAIEAQVKTTSSKEQLSELAKEAEKVEREIGILNAKKLDMKNISETSKVFKDMKEQLNNISKIKVKMSGLDNTTKEFEVLQSQLKNAEKSLTSLMATSGNRLSTEQWNELVKLSKQYSDNLDLVKAKNIDGKNLEEYMNKMNELISLNQKMNDANVKHTKATLDVNSTESQIKKLKSEFDNAKKAYDDFLRSIGSKNVDSNTWSTIQKNIENTEKKILKLQETAENAKNKLFNNIGKGIETHSYDKSISDIETKIKNLAKSGADVSKLTQSFEQLNKVYSQMQSSSKSGNVDATVKSYEELDKIIKTLQNDIGITSNKQKELSGNLNKNEVGIKSIGSELMNYAKYYFSVYQVFNAFKEGCSFVKEMDEALTNINYTMSVTKEQLQEVANKTIDMAKDLKTSTSNVMEAVTLYANSQETTDSILEKSQTAVKLSNVTGMTGEESAEMLQSVMNQFQLTQDDLEHISDTLQGASQTMAHDFADGIKEISDGIEVSGSVARSAGMSLEEYVALLGTSIEETGLQGSQIANAYKTIFLRTTKASKAFGTLEEDISASEGSLRAVGVAVRDSEGDFRDIQDILGDLASIWNDLDEVSQNNIAYNMAGIRQTNILTSLLGRWEEYQRVLTETQNSDGVTDKNQEKYEEQVSANMKELSTAFNEFWYSVMNSDTMNAILNFLTSFLEGITAITEATHGLGTVLLAVFAIKTFSSITNAVKSTTSLADAFVLLKNNAKSIDFSGIFSKGISGAKSLAKSVFSLKGAMVALGALAVWGISELCVKATKDFENAKEAFDKSKDRYDTETSENNSLNSLIEQYEKLAKVNNVDAEKRQQIQNIQEQIVDLVGEQANGLDLVNGKLSTQKKELERIAYVKAQEKANSAKDEYNKAIEEGEKAVGSYGRDGWLGSDFHSDKDHDAYLRASQILEFVGDNTDILGFVDGGSIDVSKLGFDIEGKNATEKVKNGNELLKRIEKAKKKSTSEEEKEQYDELYRQLSDSLNNVYIVAKNKIESSSYDVLDSALDTAKYKTDEKYGSNIKSYEDYLKYRENLVKTMKEDSGVKDLLDNGDADNKQIENWIDNYLCGLDELSEYYEKFQAENEKVEISTEQSFDTIRDLFSIVENKDATISLSVDDGDTVKTIENVFSAVEMASTDTTAQDMARQKLEDYATQMGITVEQLKADMDTYDLGNSIQGLWDSEDFKETRNQLVALSNSTGITVGDIEEMASESQVLSGILNTTGMSAQYLANCFNEMSNGSSALDIISTDGLALNSVLSDMDKKLQSVNSSYNEYIHSIEGNDYDAQFDSYTEAYKSMQEMIKNNEFGKKYFATAEYLLGDKANTMSVEEINKSVNGNLKTVFKDETTSGTKLLELLYAQKDAMKDLNSSVTQEDGKWKFDFDLDELSELSKIVGLTEDETLSCINALGMFGDFQSFDTDDLVEKFKSLNSVLVTESGLAVSSKEHILDLLESIGYTGREANQVLESLEKSKDIKIFDFEDTSKKGLKDTLKDLEKLSGMDFVDDKKNVNLSSMVETLISDFGLGTDRVKEFTSAMEKQGYVFTSSTGEIENLDSAIDTLANNNATLVLNKSLEQAKVSAREAVDCLNGIEIKGVEDKIEFDFDTTDLDTMDSQIEQATKILDNFKKEDGTVDLSVEGANEAQVVLSTLLRQKQQVSVPEIMQIDTSYAEGEAYDSVAKIQSLINAYNEYQIDVAIGVDTATSKANYESALKEVQKDKYIKTTVKLDTSDGESLINQVTNGDFNPIAKFGVDEKAVEEYKKKNNDIEPKVHYKLDDTSKEIQEFIQTQHTVDTTVNFKIGSGGDVYNAVKKGGEPSPTPSSTPSKKPSKKPSPTPSPTNVEYEGTANAKGNWGVERNESSLVGELGQEIVVRDGKFFTVGDNGAEIVSLKKNDIVFNHQQTRQILENGKISFGSKRGKVVGASFAEGSVPINKKSGSNDDTKTTTSNSTKSSNGTSNNNSSSDSSEDKKLDAFKKWLEKFVDWIEVRISRLQGKIEKTIASAERFAEKNNYSKSAKSYKQAINVTYKLIDVNEKGKQKYKAKADSIGNKAVKDGLVSRKEMNKIEKKVENGSLDISKYNERQKEIISSYQEYYDKSLECAKSTIELKNNIDEYSKALYNLPLEKASKEIEKLSEKLDTLSAKSSAVSGGGSVYNKVVEESAKERLDTKKAETKKADKQVKTETKKVNSATKKVNKAEKKVDTTAKKLAGNKQLTKEQKQRVKKEQKIDTSNLKGSTKKQANAYNKAVESRKKAKNNLKNAKSEKADAQKKQTKAKNEQKTAQKEYNNAVKNDKKYENSNSYTQANSVLENINKESKKEVSYNNTAKQEADKNLKDAQSAKNKADKKVESTSNKLLNNKNLSASQKKAVKNGKEINTKGLKGNALKQANAYNKALKEQAQAKAKLKIANEAQVEATNNLEKSEAEYTNTIRENTQQMLDNVEASYESEIAKKDNNIANIESDIDLKKANGSDISREDYSGVISDMQEKKRLQEEEMQVYQKTFDDNKDNMSEEEIAETEAKLLEMQNNIKETEKSILNTVSDSIQAEVDSTQNVIDELKAKNDLLNGAETKNNNIKEQIDQQKKYYDLLIEQEKNSVKQAELRAEKEKTVRDLIREQLDNIIEENEILTSNIDSRVNEGNAKFEVSKEKGQDNSYSRVGNYENDAKLQSEIANSKYDSAKQLNDKLWGSDTTDYGFWNEDKTVFYIWEHMKEDFDKGMTEYHNMMADGYKAEAEAIQDSYNAWQEQYLQPKLDAYDVLENKESELEDELSMKQLKGVDLTSDDYSGLIQNSKEKVENLKEQNRLLEEQRSGYDKDSEKYKETQKQIDDNNKSIRDAEKSQEEWNQEILNLPIENLEKVEDILSNITAKIKAINELKETKGIDLTASDYQAEWNSLEEERKNKEAQRKEYENNAQKAKENSDGLYDGHNADYWNNMAVKTETEEIGIKTDMEKVSQSILNLSVDKLKEQLAYQDSINDKIKSEVELKKALQGELSSEDYTRQIEQNDKTIENHSKTLEEYKKNALEAGKSSEGVYSGHDAEYWFDMATQEETAINNVKVENEELKKSLRDDVYWRGFEKAKETLENIQSLLSGIGDLITDEMILDDNGAFTDLGLLKISNDIEQFETAKDEVVEYSKAIEDLKRMKSQGLYDGDEQTYKDKMKELQDGLLSSAKTIQSTEQSIADMFENQMQSELDAVFELIDARNELLQKTKEYYDYSKTIKTKTKDVTTIKAKISALQGVDTNEAKAELKQLQAQLKDAEDDMEDTVNEHIMDLSTEALDDLKDILQDELDNEIKEMSSSLSNIEEYMGEANRLASSSSKQVNSALSSLLKHYGINSSDISIDGYASGTKSVDKDKLAWTQEKGSEIIVRQSDGAILTGLAEGDGVIPNGLTENLYDWGVFNPSEFLDNVVGNISVPKNATPVNVVTKYDNLLNVEGNVDEKVLPDLQTILKKSYEYTTKQQTKNLKLAGYKPKF